MLSDEFTAGLVIGAKAAPISKSDGGMIMTAALELFADLGIKAATCYRGDAPAPLETACAGVISRLICRHGLPHTVLTLRTITETAECNQRALVEPIIGAISLITAHPAGQTWAWNGWPHSTRSTSCNS